MRGPSVIAAARSRRPPPVPKDGGEGRGAGPGRRQSLRLSTSPAFEPVFGTRTVALSQSLWLGLDALVCRACRCDCPGLPLCDPPPHHHCHKPLAPRPPPLVRAERSPAPRGSRDPCARGKAPWPGNSVRESLCAEPTERLSRAVPREGARRLRRGGTLLATQGDSEGGEAAHPFPPSPNHRRDRHGPPTLNTAKHTVVGGAEGGGGVW